MFVYERFILLYSLCIINFLWYNTTAAAYWKHLSFFLFIGFIVAILFFIQLEESIYDPERFKLIL